MQWRREHFVSLGAVSDRWDLRRAQWYPVTVRSSYSRWSSDTEDAS